MSTCPDSDLFSAYVDGEIPSPWKEKLEAHIASCQECAERTERYDHLHHLLAGSGEKISLDLEASYTRLMARRSAQVSRNREKPFSWVSGSIRLPVPAMAALFMFALLIPAWFSFRAGIQTAREPQILTANVSTLSDLIAQRQDSLRLPVSDTALISNDFPAKTRSNILLDNGKSLFTVVDYSRQFSPDSNLFDNAEIVIIRLPNLAHFNSDGQSLFDGESVLPVALFEK